MALIPANEVKAQNKANGKGEITICHILGSEQLGGNDMFARVTIPAGCSIGYHEHHGNTETYHILQGEALYSDNGNDAAKSKLTELAEDNAEGKNDEAEYEEGNETETTEREASDEEVQ